MHHLNILFQKIELFNLVILLSVIISCNEINPKSDSLFCINNKCISLVKDVQIFENNGYVAAGILTDHDGTTSEEFLVFRVDDDGNVVWSNSYLSEYGGNASSIFKTIDGGYIVAGTVYGREIGNGDTDFLIVKINPVGELIWYKVFGGSSYDEAKDIIETIEGDIIVAGYTGSNDFDIHKNQGGWDCWVIKLDLDGNFLWNRTYGGSGYEVISEIKQTKDGGYMLVASSGTDNDGDVTGNYSSTDFWIVKLDAAGDIEWQQSYGGFNYDTSSSIVECLKGGYLITGNSHSSDGDVEKNNGTADLLAIKIDDLGKIEWKYCLGWSNWDGGYKVIQSIDESYYILGGTYTPHGENIGHHGDKDILLLKLDPDGNLIWKNILGYEGNDNGVAIIELQNTDVLIAALISANSYEGTDLQFFQVDAEGIIIN